MRKAFLWIGIALLAVNGAAAQDGGPKRLSLGSIEWLPDGSAILFSAMLVEPDYSDYRPDKWKLLRYTLSSGNLEILEEGVLFASMSPDGERLVFGKYADGDWEIFVRELNGGGPVQLTDNDYKDSAPGWSPDGRRIAFNSDRDGNYEIYVMNADGSGVMQITRTDSASNYNPEWSPGGDRIVYYREIGDNRDQIFLTDADGSFFRNITDDRRHNFYPSWTPDGEIVYTVGGTGIFRMRVDGTGKRLLQGAVGFYAKQSPVEPVIAILNPEKEAIFLYDTETERSEKLVGKAGIVDFIRRRGEGD